MEILIGSILDAVFASLAESGGVSDWLRDRLGRDTEKLAFRAALTQALADAGEHFPGRDLRYFAERLRDFGGPLLARTLQPAATLPTADELTAAWLTHLNLDSVVYYRADFERFATIFLTSLQNNLENQQPLQWIAQLRTQKITAKAAGRGTDAAEQSATLLVALQAQLQQLNERLADQSQTNTAGGAVVAGNVQTGRDFVGRDQITIRNYFTVGLGHLHIDYSARIEEFLLEYLGSKRKRVPFGGRTVQVAELDAWLTDRSAPPYYLMTAEAGRGKSALVCRWQTQVLTRGDVEVIFLPISIRFETATQDVVFAALAARLAAIHGEQMQAAVLSADQWRATCQSYLRRELPDGKQMLVIIDGLDEATGWSPGRGLFPSDPPDGLRVLVTARQRAGELGPQGWAATLGWDDNRLAKKTTLVGLNRVGVQEALISMGNPLDRLATQVDVIGELYRLTEGDPLLVRLYVDALVGQGNDVAYLHADELVALQHGLRGYFDRWWDEQHVQWRSEGRNPLVEQVQLRALLNAVAAALGPLTQDDLAAVTGLADGLLVRRLTQTVSRWLIGDGKQQGYTFSHPQLGSYFWEQLGADEQAAWDERFTKWGARILDNLNSDALDPKAAPRYLVHHYTAHLERDRAPAAAYYALISDGWRQAWEAVDVTYSGFLNDIALVQEVAEKAYDPTQPSRAEALVQQVKVALCRASITALGDKITPELLRLALIRNLYTPTQVLAIVRLMHEDNKRAKALVALFDHLPGEQLEEALTIARAIEDESIRAGILEAVAPLLLPSLLEEALVTVPMIQDEWYRFIILGTLAESQQSEWLGEALAAARAIEDEYFRASALGMLAPQLAESQRSEALVEALAAARSIRSGWYRAPALGALAPQLAESQRSEVLAEALAAAREIENESIRARILCELVPQLPPPLLGEALTAARAIRTESIRAHVLGELVPQLAESQRPEVLAEALVATQAIGIGWERVRVLVALVPQLAESQRPAVLAEALDVARSIRHGQYRAHALVALVPHLPSSQLAEVLSEAQTVRNEVERARVFQDLALQLAESQQPEVLAEVLAAAQTISHGSDRDHFLAALIPQLPPLLLGEALVAIWSIKDERSRTSALKALPPRLAESHQPEVFTEALAMARSIRTESIRSSLLVALAPQLAESQQLAVLVEALAAVREIGDKSTHAYLLVALEQHMPVSQLAVLAEARAAVHAIENETDRTNALEARAVTRAIKYEKYRVDKLEVLTSQVPENQRIEVLTTALTAARGIEDVSDRAIALGALVPHLPPSLLEEALAAARAIGLKLDRAIVLSELAARFGGSQQSIVLTEALALVQEIGNEYHRAETLAVLVPQLINWGRNAPESAYPVYSTTLQRLSQRPRPEFARDLEALLPFVLALAGNEATEAATGVYEALRDVYKWWP